MLEINGTIKVGDQFKMPKSIGTFKEGELVDVIKILPFDDIEIKSNQCSRKMEIEISSLKD